MTEAIKRTTAVVFTDQDNLSPEDVEGLGFAKDLEILAVGFLFDTKHGARSPQMLRKFVTNTEAAHNRRVDEVIIYGNQGIVTAGQESYLQAIPGLNVFRYEPRGTYTF